MQHVVAKTALVTLLDNKDGKAQAAADICRQRAAEYTEVALVSKQINKQTINSELAPVANERAR